MPDFDIDFEDTQRQRVIDYCAEKYGQEKVCSIGTFMKMATKAAFKDSARAVGVPFEMANQISNIIPEKSSLKRNHRHILRNMKNFTIYEYQRKE